MKFDYHCALKTIAKLPKLHHLRSLDLTFTDISESVFNALIDAAPNLNEIDISYAKNLANYVLSNPKIKLKNIKIITEVREKTDQVYESSSYEYGPSSYKVIPEPRHDLENKLHYKPSREPFIYRGKNHRQNQAMIIEKISQYWTVTNQHVMQIPKIQNGICDALSYLFIEKTKNGII